MNKSQKSICLSFVFLLILYICYSSKFENFKEIAYEKDKKELQQLYKDYYYYDYKNYNFSKLYDKEGDVRNPTFFSYLKNINELKMQNNQNFKTSVLLDTTPMSEIMNLNENAVMPPFFRNYTRNNEEVDSINNVGAKCDNDIKDNLARDNVQFNNKEVKETFGNFKNLKSLYDDSQTQQFENNLNGAKFCGLDIMKIKQTKLN